MNPNDSAPKKARIRDVVGIWLLGTAITIMSPEWRKYTRMLVAASVIREVAEEAVAKHKPAMAPDGRMPGMD